MQTPRGEWPMGVVIKTFESEDKLVRRVLVKTARGVLDRAVHKLVLLEATEEEEQLAETQQNEVKYDDAPCHSVGTVLSVSDDAPCFSSQQKTDPDHTKRVVIQTGDAPCLSPAVCKAPCTMFDKDYGMLSMKMHGKGVSKESDRFLEELEVNNDSCGNTEEMEAIEVKGEMRRVQPPRVVKKPSMNYKSGKK